MCALPNILLVKVNEVNNIISLLEFISIGANETSIARTPLHEIDTNVLQSNCLPSMPLPDYCVHKEQTQLLYLHSNRNE